MVVEQKPLSEFAGSSRNEGHIFLNRFTSLIWQAETEFDPDCCCLLRRLLRLQKQIATSQSMGKGLGMQECVGRS